MKSLILLFLISSLYAAPGPTSPRVLFFFDSTDPGIRYEAGWTDPGRFFPVFTIDNTWWSGAMFFDYGLNYDSPVSIGYNYLVTIQYTLILVDSNGNGAVVFGSNGITYMSTPFKDAVDFGQDLGNDLGPELKKTFNHNLITNDLFLHMVWFSYGTVPAPTAKGKKAAAATTNFPQAWGLQDVTITIYNCVEFCQVCNNNFRCIQCINGFYRRSWDDYDECIVCPLADPYCTFNQPIAYFEFQRKMNSSGFTGNQGYTPSITITTPQATAFGRVFGYFTTTSRFTKTFTGLHTHTFVAFDFDAVIVDQVIQGVDYLEVLVSGSPTVYRSNFQQSAGTTKSWSISTNFTHTGSSFTVTFQATLTHPLNKWGVGNLTFSMDKCMDPVALTCSFPYISNSCPVGYYLRTDSIHYITCQPCPTGYSNCQESNLLPLK